MRVPEERERVVLAEGGEGDRALDDLRERLSRGAVALRRERRHQLGIPVVARGRVVQRSQEPLGRGPRARRVERQAERLEDLGDVPAEPVPVLRGDVARVGEGARGGRQLDHGLGHRWGSFLVRW